MDENNYLMYKIQADFNKNSMIIKVVEFNVLDENKVLIQQEIWTVLSSNLVSRALVENRTEYNKREARKLYRQLTRENFKISYENVDKVFQAVDDLKTFEKRFKPEFLVLD